MEKGRAVRRPFALILSVFMVLTALSGVTFAAEESSAGYPVQDTGSPLTETQAPLLDSLLDSNAHNTITAWKWVDEDEVLMWDGERSAWVLIIAADAENPVSKALVLDVLPKEILATMADGTERKIGVVWDETNLDIIDGRAWDGSYTIDAYPTEGIIGEGVPPLRFILILDNPTLLALTEEDLEPYIVKDVIDPPNTTVNLFDYYIDEPVAGVADTTVKDINDRHPYDDEAKMPNVNFNTWTPNKDGSYALNENGTLAELVISPPEKYNKNINKDHLLLFGDTLGHAGLWNRGAGQTSPFGRKYAGMENIVKNNLIEGYPAIKLENAQKELLNDKPAGANDARDFSVRDFRLIKYFNLSGEHNGYSYRSLDGYYPNISNNVIDRWEAATGQSIDGADAVESLDYLFDPEKDHAGKKTYTNVKGLFQLDEEGYYYYNIRKNFAEFVEEEDNNHFILYNAPATFRSDGNASIGNFFPFNKGTEVFQLIDDGKPSSGENINTGIASNANIINHYMGMTVELTFRQSLDGTIQMGENGTQPMTFQFSGDDDVWVFIDDVLVLDIGGVHSELYGTIDFATGEVLVGRSFNTNGIPTKEQIQDDIDNPDLTGGPRPVTTTTLRQCFEDAGAVDETNWRDDTFASNTIHTLKMFYLERGNYDSSLALRFNLQPLLYQQLRKVDRDGQPLKDVEFTLYPAEEVTDPAEIALVEAMGAEEMKEKGYIACDNKDGVTNPDGIFYVKEKKTGGGSTPLTVLTTDENGEANFIKRLPGDSNPDPDEKTTQADPFNFSDNYHKDETTGKESGKYYILRETKVPQGYRTPPLDIALEFDSVNTMITVANRWSVGAYASFVDNIQGTSDITYGSFQEGSGKIEPDTSKRVPVATQQKGLIMAVPMIQDGTDESRWNAAYGDNINGFSVIKPGEVSASEWRMAVLEAALCQCAESVRSPRTTGTWNLGWVPSQGRLTGQIEGLPGVASRYLLQDPDGDMQAVYGIITPEGLKELGIDPDNYHTNDGQGKEITIAEQVYKALGEYIIGKVGAGASKTELQRAAKEIASEILNVPVADTGSGAAFSFLNVDQFERSFRSILFIPNEQREIRVRKVDQNNRPVQGAVFGIYKDEACQNLVINSNGEPATGSTDAEGDLIFAPYNNGTMREDGYAKMEWVTDDADMTQYGARFYLREISCPEGYEMNETVVPVVVGFYSIYADAGTPEDGVAVMAGVGKLNQTMKKYAQDEDINISLRDIRAIAQKQPSGSFDLYGWEDVVLEDTGSPGVKRYMNLHYKLNEVVDYGLHDQDGGQVVEPFFTTDTGFLRPRVYQNSRESQHDLYGATESGLGKFEDLGDIELTNLFSLLNIVVITDPKPGEDQGSLLLSKHIVGNNFQEADYTRNFYFTIEFTDENGSRLPGEYHFYGTDKEGTIESGESLPLHHDEEIVIRGLPYGTRYKVTEVRDNDTQVKFPYVTPSQGVVEGQLTQDDPHAALPFVNSNIPVASFRIQKTVTGNAGEQEKDFHFTVTLRDENGQPLPGSYLYVGDANGHIASGGTITLRHDQSVTVEGLPLGAGYTVTEQEANQDGYITTFTGNTGSNLTEDSTPVADFRNHRDVTAFTIRKTVTGSGGSHSRDFHFTVILRDENGNELPGYYSYTGSKTGEVKSGDVITLHHGQQVTIGGLPVGAAYLVTEQEADRNGYTTTITGAAGSGLTVDEVPVASFVNHRDDDDDDDDPDDPPHEDPGEPDKPNPHTGDITETGGWTALSLAFLAGIGGILYWRWRKKKNAQ